MNHPPRALRILLPESHRPDMTAARFKSGVFDSSVGTRRAIRALGYAVTQPTPSQVLILGSENCGIASALSLHSRQRFQVLADRTLSFTYETGEGVTYCNVEPLPLINQWVPVHPTNEKSEDTFASAEWNAALQGLLLQWPEPVLNRPNKQAVPLTFHLARAGLTATSLMPDSQLLRSREEYEFVTQLRTREAAQQVSLRSVDRPLTIAWTGPGIYKVVPDSGWSTYLYCLGEIFDAAGTVQMDAAWLELGKALGRYGLDVLTLGASIQEERISICSMTTAIPVLSSTPDLERRLALSLEAWIDNPHRN